jgi:hypothetical protein
MYFYEWQLRCTGFLNLAHAASPPKIILASASKLERCHGSTQGMGRSVQVNAA